MSLTDLPASDGGTMTDDQPGPRRDRPRRRTFSAAYKLRLLDAYDQATGPGERGALLRRDRFGSMQDARQFCRSFFEFYNFNHYHSGIGLHTPFTAHIGTAHAVQHKRVETIEAFRAANPQRFTRRPVLPGLPEAAWINEPQEQPAVEQRARHLQEVA